jgi:pimeloyl-ACP methyl ester carboxylesterase
MLIKTTTRYALRWMPARAALAITRSLAARTKRLPVSPAERAAMAAGKRLRHEGDTNETVAWAWGAVGPLVVLVHGWGGRAAQMAPLAAQLAAGGFRAVAIEVTGHGESSKRSTRWDCFLNEVPALVRSLGTPVFAFVAHSAGALSVMAARALRGLRAERYVCIGAPSHPFPALVAVETRLGPPSTVLEDYRRFIAAQFETTWSRLEAGSSFEGVGAETLLIYDRNDRVVPHEEGDRLRALYPAARLVKTTGLGHVRILGAAEVGETVRQFLSP